MTTPPLPERYDVVTRANPDTAGYVNVPVWSECDVRSYGEACYADGAAAERGRCAKTVEAQGGDDRFGMSVVHAKSYETLRAVATLIREGHAGDATPTPHQAREMARGIVALCDDVRRVRSLVESDGHAATFQTMGQYRSALLREIPRA